MSAGSSLKNAKAILLDAEGTLIRLRGSPTSTYARIAERHGHSIPAVVLREQLGPAIRARPVLPDSPLSSQAFAEFERATWREILSQTLGRWAGQDPFFSDLFDFYGSAQAWQAMPHACSALRALKRAGIGLAVVSNMDGRLPQILDALEIRPLLDALWFPAQSGLAKPDPSLYRAACEGLGAEPAEALYIGDRERDCLEGARKAGLQALRFDPQSSDTAELRDWAQLTKRLGLPSL